MVDAFEANPSESVFQRTGQNTRKLDERHSEVLRGVPGQSRPGAKRQRRVRDSKVVESDPAASPHRQVRGVAEAPTEPQPDGQRQPADDGQRRTRS